MKAKRYIRLIKENPNNKHNHIQKLIDEAIREATVIFNKAGDRLSIQLTKLINQTDLVCHIPFQDYYHLERGWFRKILAQSLADTNEAVVRLWTRLGWDFNDDRNPTYKAEDTIEPIILRFEKGDLEVKLRLVPTSNPFPPCAEFRNKRSGIVWKIIDSEINNNYIEVLMECDTVEQRTFSGDQLRNKNNWERL